MKIQYTLRILKKCFSLRAWTTFFFSASIHFFCVVTYAQDSEQGSAKGLHELGVFAGKILPKSIPGANEIFSLTGFRYSYPLSQNGFVDFGGLFGNGEGVKWQGLFLGASMHVPIETLIGHAGLGLDLTRYETESTETKNIGGVHFIGGVMSHIGGNLLARFDMKMNSKPGSSLFFAIGFVFAMDFAGGGSGGDGG